MMMDFHGQPDLPVLSAAHTQAQLQRQSCLPFNNCFHYSNFQICIVNLHEPITQSQPYNHLYNLVSLIPHPSSSSSLPTAIHPPPSSDLVEQIPDILSFYL